MATAPYRDLNDAQRRAKKVIDLATDSVINYKAKEVPPMGNLTVEGLVEELGFLNEARKALETTEKILKERIKSRISIGDTIKSDNFTLVFENRGRTALDQGAAKAYLEEHANLADFMVDTDVPTMVVKAN